MLPKQNAYSGSQSGRAQNVLDHSGPEIGSVRWLQPLTGTRMCHTCAATEQVAHQITSRNLYRRWGLSLTLCDNTDTSSCIHVFKIFSEFLFYVYTVRRWMRKNFWILPHTLYFVCFPAELHKYWHKNHMPPDESNSLKFIFITTKGYYIIKQR